MKFCSGKSVARYAILSVLGLLTACVATDPPPVFNHADEVARVLTLPEAQSRIRADVAYLADDKMEGREAGTRGYDAAADYVAARMAAIGLTPGNEGAWFQDVPFRVGSLESRAAQMSITNQAGDVVRLKPLDEYKLYPSLERASIAVEAPAVFVGYGVYAPEAGLNDYEGLDLDGKIVVRFGGAPAVFNSEERAHYGSSGSKAEYIASQGAIGFITIYTEEFEKRFPWSNAKRNPVSSDTTWIRPDGAADVSGPGLLGSAIINPESSEILFDGAARSYADVRAEAAEEGAAPKGFDLPVTVAIEGVGEFDEFTSANVIGVIEGVDPQLKHEALVVTAHLDHVGVDDFGRGQKDDRINNGAMDNALGVAMLLETAQRFTDASPPARTVVFLAVTAEEKGLLGADYFARHPTLGDKEIIANINLDMPLMLHSFTDIVAFGAERSSLGAIVETMAADAGVQLSPDPLPEQGIFTRSDHYRFVEQGVPSIYLWPGFANGGEEIIRDFLQKHYHKPSDDMLLPVRWDAAARFADINFRIAQEVANRAERPTWNEGDFFGDLFAGAN